MLRGLGRVLQGNVRAVGAGHGVHPAPRCDMSGESQAAKRDRLQRIITRLRRAYPDARCELIYGNPLELLILTILSVRCTVKQFNREDLEYIFAVAHEMRTMVERVGTFDLLKGKILANLFYEPSTRTSSSFTAVSSPSMRLWRLCRRVHQRPKRSSSVGWEKQPRLTKPR